MKQRAHILLCLRLGDSKPSNVKILKKYGQIIINGLVKQLQVRKQITQEVICWVA